MNCVDSVKSELLKRTGNGTGLEFILTNETQFYKKNRINNRISSLHRINSNIKFQLKFYKIIGTIVFYY